MLTTPIEIPILCHTETSHNAQLAGIEPKFSEMETRTILFYNITALAPNFQDNVQYTEIHANGDCFISPMDIEDIQDLITIAQAGIIEFE